MGAAIGLRADFDGAALRRLARKTKNANQSRRLLALAEIYDGGSRSDAARIGGVGLQIVRDHCPAGYAAHAREEGSCGSMPVGRMG